MSTQTENRCLRGCTDCVPLANIQVGGKLEEGALPEGFICVGLNSIAGRQVPQDRFTHCWKNEAFDERSDWDKRDLMDTMSVIAQALSNDENMRVNMGVEESEMQRTNFLP